MVLAVANHSFQPSAHTTGHEAARKVPALRAGSHMAGDGVSHLDLSTHCRMGYPHHNQCLCLVLLLATHLVAAMATRSVLFPATPQPKWKITATTGRDSGVFWDSALHVLWLTNLKILPSLQKTLQHTRARKSLPYDELLKSSILKKA